MSKRCITLSVLLSSILLSPVSWADIERDFSQPILVDADREELDLRANRLVLHDNVVIQQGTLRITADQLNVESETELGSGDSEVFIATGNPATYQQEVEPGMLVEASAGEIRYDAATRVISLLGNATMQQGGNQVSANRIVYYIDEQRVTAERGEDDDQRVRNIFQPRPRDDDSTQNNNSSTEGN